MWSELKHLNYKIIKMETDIGSQWLPKVKQGKLNPSQQELFAPNLHPWPLTD